jgi:hypothetical protein
MHKSTSDSLTAIEHFMDVTGSIVIKPEGAATADEERERSSGE